MTGVDPYSQLHLLRRLGPLDFRVHSFQVVLPVNSVRPQGIPICKGHWSLGFNLSLTGCAPCVGNNLSTLVSTSVEKGDTK